MSNEQLLDAAQTHVLTFFAENVDPKYVFHDAEHTVQTVAATRLIAEGYKLAEHEMTLLTLAAWFHDTGYAQGGKDHEERSCVNATNFLKDHLSEYDLEIVLGCIRATKVPQMPKTLLEQILCDADLSQLGMKTYWDRTGKLRQEINLTRNMIKSEQEWLEFEINFMLSHDYHTLVAQELFNKRKAKHVQQLLKQKRRLNPEGALTAEELALMDEKDRSSDFKTMLQEAEDEVRNSKNHGRGVETMYRTTYRTHTNLSSMADSKANLMLSVNAIVISILVSNLLPKLQDSPRLIVPTILLTLTCLGSMVYATLSTRPKVTEGNTTREAIKKRNVNLLFFGNFYNMKLEDFQWGVNEMLRDPEFLYSSMSRDLYFLGIVLAKKYQYLSICYNIFMYGLIASVLSFGIAFII